MNLTKEQIIETYLMNSPKVVAEMLYDTITNYENRKCESCRFDYGCSIQDKLELQNYETKFGCTFWEKR